MSQPNIMGLSYQVAPRAKIMRRDQSKVVDIKSAQDFSRYNGMYPEQISLANRLDHTCYYTALHPLHRCGQLQHSDHRNYVSILQRF